MILDFTGFSDGSIYVYDCPGVAYMTSIMSLVNPGQVHIVQFNTKHANVWGSDVDITSDQRSQLIKFLRNGDMEDSLASWFMQMLGFLPTYVEKNGERSFRSLDFHDS